MRLDDWYEKAELAPLIISRIFLGSLYFELYKIIDIRSIFEPSMDDNKPLLVAFHIYP